MTNKGTVGRTGEELLASISDRLKNFPNISYMASKVQDLLNAAKPMTGATSASAGVSGFVPVPPAQATTDNTYALLGSDGIWHTQADATGNGNVTQKTLNKNSSDQYITSEVRSYLLGSGSYANNTQVTSVYDVENIFVSSYKGPDNTTADGILQKLEDTDLHYYYSSYRSGSRLDYTGNIINRFQINDSNTGSANIYSTDEFILGKYLTMVSNSAVIESTAGIPKAAIILGNTEFNSSSSYKPYVIKVAGNKFMLYYSGQKNSVNTSKSDHYILSELDPIKGTNYRWSFYSRSGFLFNNALIVNGESNIPRLNATDYYLGEFGTYSSYRNSTELRFASYNVTDNKQFRTETGFDALMYETSTLYKTSAAGSGVALAKFEYPTNGLPNYEETYSNIKLAAYLKLTDTLYISTDTKVNGTINIWPQYVNNYTTSANYREIPSDAYSTKKNYKNESIGNAVLNFMGPYDYTSSSDTNLRDGITKYTISVNNNYSNGGVNYQKFDIMSNNGFTERSIMSIQRTLSSTYSAELILDADLNLNNTGKIKNVSDFSATKITAVTLEATGTNSSVKTTKISGSSVTVDGGFVNITKGKLYTSGTRVDLPVEEPASSGSTSNAQTSDTFYYRPIIITKSDNSNTIVKNILANAKNGYIWAYTG